MKAEKQIDDLYDDYNVTRFFRTRVFTSFVEKSVYTQNRWLSAQYLWTDTI